MISLCSSCICGFVTSVNRPPVKYPRMRVKDSGPKSFSRAMGVLVNRGRRQRMRDVHPPFRNSRCTPCKYLRAGHPRIPSALNQRNNSSAESRSSAPRSRNVSRGSPETMGCAQFLGGNKFGTSRVDTCLRHVWRPDMLISSISSLQASFVSAWRLAISLSLVRRSC